VLLIAAFIIAVSLKGVALDALEVKWFDSGDWVGMVK